VTTCPPNPSQLNPRILHVFERLEYLEPAQGFLGCPFVAAAVQLKSPEHPASVVARRQKDGLTSVFQHEAERGGAPDPAQLARQLTLDLRKEAQSSAPDPVPPDRPCAGGSAPKWPKDHPETSDSRPRQCIPATGGELAPAAMTRAARRWM